MAIYLPGCYSIEPEKTGFEGKHLPSFKILLSDSSTYLDTKDIPDGKPVVLLYYSPNCAYSRGQVSEIIENIVSLKDIRFYIFTTWPFDEMKMFNAHFQLNNYSNITVGIDYNKYFADYFDAQGVPYMAIYGKDKRLNQAFIGQVYSKQIKEVATK